MSSTTGILTLSVHEALTFDGTEIALHPDLFAGSSTPTSGAAIGGGGGGSSVIGTVVGSSNDDLAATGGAPLLTPIPGGGGGGGSVVGGGGVGGAASVVGQTPVQCGRGASVGLEVGDMIEIRVWNPRPGHTRAVSGGMASFRTAVAAAASATVGQQGGGRSGVGSNGPSPPSLLAPAVPLTNMSAVSANSEHLYGISYLSTPVSVLTATTVEGSGVTPPAAGGAAQKVPTPPASPSDKSKESTTVSSATSSAANSASLVPPPSGAAAAAAASAGQQLAQRIPMRRDGSSGSGAVEARDIIAPTLGDPMPQQQQQQQQQQPALDGATGGTNPQDGGGLQPNSSSLSSSPNVVPPASAASSAASAVAQAAAPAALPPLPPTRPPRSRANTSESTGGQSFHTTSQPVQAAAAPAQKDNSSSVAVSSLPPRVGAPSSAGKVQAQPPPLPAASSSGGTVPQTPVPQGNRARTSTLPTGLEAARSAEKERSHHARSNTSLSPKALAGVASSSQSAAPGMPVWRSSGAVGGGGKPPTVGKQDPPPFAPVPVVSGKVGGEAGHVRDISRLSVGSEFGTGGGGGAGAGGGSLHVRDGSSLSSVLGEHLVAPSLSSEGDPMLAAAGKAAAGSSGRVARSLMLSGRQGHIPPRPSHRRLRSVEDHEADMQERIAETHDLRTSFVMVVTEKTLTSIKGSARTQISILRQVADLYNLSSYDHVTVTKINKSEAADVLEAISADFVLVTIKDQFISRGEMHHFQDSLVGRWIYEGLRLDSSGDGIRANAMEIRHADRLVASGIVTEDTKITFRSRSSRIIWLVQISSEMWDYASPYEAQVGGKGAADGEADSTCEIYFDKFVAFMHRLLEKWKELEVTHSLTVVFFSRTYVSQHVRSDLSRESSIDGGVDGSALRRDVDGRIYEDHYKMILENETRPDWQWLVHKIKKAFVSYPTEVGWNLSLEEGRVPSTATQGNLLEAINITLNLLQQHYMDRDLHRTGNSIVIASAGCGVFEVDKGLAGITKQRMMDNGIGSDMLSLSLPPLHVAPFFLYKEVVDSTARGFDDYKTYFEIPHWMHLSYFSYDDGNVTATREGTLSQMNAVASGNFAQCPGIRTFANGFLVRGPEEAAPPTTPSSNLRADSSGLPKLDSTVTLHSAQLPPPQFGDKSHSQRQQRHLISSREFEDILEACRPRSRGESFSTVPSALSMLLRKKPKAAKKQDDLTEKQKEKQIAHDAALRNANDLATVLDRSTFKSSELQGVSEWGAVDFGSIGGGLMRTSSKGAISRRLVEGGEPSLTPFVVANDGSGSDKSSPSSSFASHYSFLLGRSVDHNSDHLNSSTAWRSTQGGGLGSIQIQPSFDLKVPLLSGADEETNMACSKSNRSDDSLSTMASGEILSSEKGGDPSGRPMHAGGHAPDDENNRAARRSHVSALRKIMSTYDSNIFSPPKHQKHELSAVGIPSVPNLGTRESPTMWRGHSRSSATPRGYEVVERGSSRFSISKGQPVGGIGAALVQFDGAGKPLIAQHDATTLTRSKSSMRMVDRYANISAYGMSSSFGRLDEGGERTFSPSQLLPVGMPLSSDPPDRVRLHPTALAAQSGNFPHNGTSLISDRGLVASSGHLVVSGGVADVSTEGPPRTNGQPGIRYLSAGDVAAPGRNARKHSSHHDHYRSQSPTKKSSSHHHHRHGSGHKGKSKKKHHRHHHAATSIPAAPSQHSRRKAWVLNPFRQQDEEEVLAKRTHNRRRWSHVFPLGEIEFKRHAGPNWKSLCQPAILPTTIDYHPSPQELSDPSKFQFSHYDVSLDAMDKSFYSSHSELLREMVVQRLIQDFQIVPQSVIKQSTSRGEAERKAQLLAGKNKPLHKVSEGGLLSAKRAQMMRNRPPQPFAQGYQWPSSSGSNNIQHTLSMGHRLVRLSYNPLSDAIEVVQYYSRFATNDPANVQAYTYNLWCPSQQRYTKVTQQFRKYAEEYLWNKVDNLICGDAAKKLFEGSRYRRIMFRILPDDISDPSKEADYVKKFQRLQEYLSKQLSKEDQMDIKIVTSADSGPDDVPNTRRRNIDPFKRFTIQLRKGTRGQSQWFEMALDSIFNTSHTYKIMLHWLVASAIKVEAQVQLLQRRCNLFGLRLVSFPQDSISSDVQLHPFIAPILIPIRDKDKANSVETAFTEQFHFIKDGSILMDAKYLEEEGSFADYDFPVSRFGRRLKFPAKQFVHHSGTLFVRVLRDSKGLAVVIVYENRIYISGEEGLVRTARCIFRDLKAHIASVLAEGRSE